ncbi:MAG: hypothetical protein QM493_02460 [Sulfurovum sp.]
MRKYMIFLPIFIFIIVGCGNRDSEDSNGNTGSSGGQDNVLPDPVIEEEIIPIYDLAEYMFPEFDQNNLYQESVSEKLTDSVSAKYIDIYEPTYYDNSYINIDNNISLVIDGVYEYDYRIEYDTITIIDLLNSEDFIINRIVEIGDNINEDSKTDVINGLNELSTYTCSINNYWEQKIIDKNPNLIYTDVIEKYCTKEYDSYGTLYHRYTQISGIVTETYLYAKGVGLIASTIEDCQSITLGTDPDNYSCLKTETLLISQKPL